MTGNYPPLILLKYANGMERLAPCRCVLAVVY